VILFEFIIQSFIARNGNFNCEVEKETPRQRATPYFDKRGPDDRVIPYRHYNFNQTKDIIYFHKNRVVAKLQVYA